MTDDPQNQNRGRSRRARADGEPAREPRSANHFVDPAAGAADADDPMVALERLQSLGTSATAAATGQAPTALQRTRTEPAARASRPRPRPAAASGNGRMAARIAAPAVFLVALIALVSIVFSSGVLTGSKPSTSSTPPATKTKSSGSHSATKMYRIKSGDTLSGIAAKFNTTTSEIQTLNPTMGSTLVTGQKIRVPKH